MIFWYIVANSAFFMSAVFMLAREARREWLAWKDWHCFQWQWGPWSWPEISDDYDEFGITHRHRFIGPVQMRYWL
jgi:hypothetical protein